MTVFGCACYYEGISVVFATIDEAIACAKADKYDYVVEMTVGNPYPFHSTVWEA